MVPSRPTPRRSSSELRSLIVDAGLSVLYHRGLRATASHVPMTEALAVLERTKQIKVGMGSIFGPDRLWPSVKEFQLELLTMAISDRTGDGPNQSTSGLVDLLPEARDQPVAERIDILLELCRAAGLLNGAIDPEVGRNWIMWVSIWATAMSDSKAGAELLPRLRAGDLVTIEEFALLYQAMLERLGLRLRQPYTIEQFAIIVAALTDGVTLRSGIVPERLAHAPSPHKGEWNLLGTAMAAIALQFIEDDVPDEE